MRVILLLEDLTAPGPKWWAQAWYQTGWVFVRRPFHVILLARARLAHELGHALGEPHHPWTHFCLRSPIALRLRWTHSAVTRDQADALHQHHVVDLPATEEHGYA